MKTTGATGKETAMAEEERGESEGFTEAVDPTLEPGEIPADLLEERAEASEA